MVNLRQINTRKHDILESGSICTTENITKWTKEALEAIGLTVAGLLGQEDEGEDGQ